MIPHRPLIHFLIVQFHLFWLHRWHSIGICNLFIWHPHTKTFQYACTGNPQTNLVCLLSMEQSFSWQNYTFRSNTTCLTARKIEIAGCSSIFSRGLQLNWWVNIVRAVINLTFYFHIRNTAYKNPHTIVLWVNKHSHRLNYLLPIFILYLTLG